MAGLGRSILLHEVFIHSLIPSWHYPRACRSERALMGEEGPTSCQYYLSLCGSNYKVLRTCGKQFDGIEGSATASYGYIHDTDSPLLTEIMALGIHAHGLAWLGLAWLGWTLPFSLCRPA